MGRNRRLQDANVDAQTELNRRKTESDEKYAMEEAERRRVNKEIID